MYDESLKERHDGHTERRQKQKQTEEKIQRETEQRKTKNRQKENENRITGLTTQKDDGRHSNTGRKNAGKVWNCYTN